MKLLILVEDVFSKFYQKSDFNTKVSSIEKANDKVTIADADIVVSAGRGIERS